MEKELRWFVIVLACIGAAAILCAAVWSVGYLAFEHFGGGNCTDTEQQVLKAPDGSRTIKSFHRECDSVSGAYFVYLSTGNPNKGYEYAPIAEIDDVAPRQVSVHWNGSNEVDITYPRSAKVGDTYAKVLGVRVILNPPL